MWAMVAVKAVANARSIGTKPLRPRTRRSCDSCESLPSCAATIFAVGYRSLFEMSGSDADRPLIVRGDR